MLKVQEIRELIKLIDESSIDEFSYETNGTTISMKKSSGEQIVKAEPVPAVEKRETAVQQTEAPQTAPVEKPAEVSQEEPVANTPSNAVDYDHEIVSPMVGTFYSSPSPDSDVYVKVGSQVEKSSIVCIVEAMKLFNEIEAEANGEIVEILVENGELVEYGQPLFRVKTK
ncbi:Biotin carboxyl carrier protein of acetyl-CoA carboxylase [Lentibacillus sp. JNUCC-1]|uniref:acetyl-CoA carboxylase biotin carboxyl carrier protein n=1 Tax=Lentibacillus sp. JNUCC-1 TaxID=2654513 RepID=UPI0012E8A400|nr:acetyl-CoA carboxylase biotin carboxyl carrier protein [Lentibacillus sp. JNUCC-1]MUV39676.1 Biotin carboxyl carrier protein of acetyl-CoA carboxylase [Lentibacillus sp. JNUCC-1]